MRQDFAYGVIPIVTSQPPQFLLIAHHKGHWGFPKGHKEAAESDEEAALRELAEETGLVGIPILDDVSFTETYTFERPDGEAVHKTNRYFVALIPPPPPPVTVQASEVSEYAWLTAPEAQQQLTFAEGKTLLQQCLQWLATQTTTE
ncbi:MAG: NUDIX domain-containing protein [Synechococcales cyanobacterium]